MQVCWQISPRSTNRVGTAFWLHTNIVLSHNCGKHFTQPEEPFTCHLTEPDNLEISVQRAQSGGTGSEQRWPRWCSETLLLHAASLVTYTQAHTHTHSRIKAKLTKLSLPACCCWDCSFTTVGTIGGRLADSTLTNQILSNNGLKPTRASLFVLNHGLKFSRSTSTEVYAKYYNISATNKCVINQYLPYFADYRAQLNTRSTTKNEKKKYILSR